MSSNVQDMKNIAMLKDSEAYKYFNKPEVKFIKTHKRDKSIYINNNNSEYEYVSSIGMKRKRVN